MDDKGDSGDDDEGSSIVSLFDSVCVSYGDQDAITLPSQSICFIELQEYSKDLARQMHSRFRAAEQSSFVLVDCKGHVAAETVAVLACMRLGVPFVPVSCEDQHSGGRLNVVVNELERSSSSETIPVAVVCCDNDSDPLLGVFTAARVHRFLMVDRTGNLVERLPVPFPLPPTLESDKLYVLFTSGTSSNSPKAVVGSHRSTLRRLKWFLRTFSPCPRVGRRTRLTFVDSITELFGALLTPTTIVAVDPDTMRLQGVGALLDFQCTQVTLLPSQLSQLLLNENVSCLERVIVSGEPCPASLVREFRSRLPSAELVNLYGQTETTGDVCCAVLTQMKDPIVDGVVAVGKRILPKIQVVSLDERQQLIVCGNLALGYLSTADKFEHFTAFPTGDTGFCKEDVWYIRGRCDDGRKVNGIWTWPTEVETAFTTMYGVNSAACIMDSQVYVVVDRPVPFSREEMRLSGLPWNLIPKRVFERDRIPTQTSGAAKVDRRKVQEFVRGRLGGETGHPSMSSVNAATFESILAEVLKLQNDDAINSILDKSFVELGGESASAVTFLYQLRKHKLCDMELTARHILSSDHIKHIKDSIHQPSIPKRLRRCSHLPYRQRPPSIVSVDHTIIEFNACVDAPPLVLQQDHKLTIFAACQGGLIQRVSWNEKFGATVDAFYELGGWMIQAGLIFHQNSALIACAYRSGDSDSGGIVISLSLDLQTTHWRFNNQSAIKATPTVSKDKLIVCCDDSSILVLSISTGKPVARRKVSLPSNTKPLLHDDNRFIICNSGHDGGMLLVTIDTTLEVKKATNIVGPVHKDAIQTRDRSLLVADLHGSIHHLDSRLTVIKSRKLSNLPLSKPMVLSDKVFVGSNDGIVYCLRMSDLGICWSLGVESCVVAAPSVSANGGYLVICTTSGHVKWISIDHGVCLATKKISAEIWSNPSHISGTSVDLVVFGARDSRLHLVSSSLED